MNMNMFVLFINVFHQSFMQQSPKNITTTIESRENDPTTETETEKKDR